ncbi:efflux RND transporter periplasmic adaptor subunit [Shewanella sp. SR44-3]|uniref:efflux RND transporter periplasmic adaptor subunit n=1 Tax=Shewanella sp. SR44-3 TaxID=2760936 RepID=UPI0015F81F36|nr:efflux RND transporter periplasmic adaptor subunit [Shewanella sp. SR44-3]MBB1269670.1 efflux RND transporter periplasmic adaptor subunit [Shewanella sp. SR44-3]
MKNQTNNAFLATSSVGVSLLFSSLLSFSLLALAGLGFQAQAGEGHGHDATPKASVNAKPLVANTLAGSQEAQAHGEEEHGDEALKLTQVQRNLAGIEVSELQAQHFNLASFATATLLVDRDKTASLGAQLEVKILARHVVPGQRVEAGQTLLTLGGAAVAQAQADYINAASEWNRVKRLSNGAISDSQRMQAEVNAELKRAILQSLKMSKGQISALASSPSSIGSYQLQAPFAGRVQQDIAMLGQVLPAGTALMQLTDESSLWVEAQLSPAQADTVDIGSQALVRVEDNTLQGEIIGRSHEIDSITRTEQVLLRIANTEHQLHAGQFAELYLTSNAGANANPMGIVVPDAALTRSGDGDWQVFVEDEDGFEAVEVQVLERQRGLSLISGLGANAKVVVSGAFFLASELAKSGFDIHNH